MQKKTLYYDVPWAEIEETSEKLSMKLKKLRAFDCIIAVTRGGLIPAGLIARYLDILKIETICIQSYDDKTQGELNLIKDVSSDYNQEDVLIVDDLVDTGATLNFVRNKLPKATYATLFAKKDAINTVDYFEKEMDQNTWLIFPWEKLA